MTARGRGGTYFAVSDAAGRWPVPAVPDGHYFIAAECQGYLLLKTAPNDGNGNFRIHDVAPGEYRLPAWVGDEPDENRAVTIRAEADGDLRVTLRAR